MEFNREIFETEEDYIFQLAVCTVLKTLNEHTQLTYKDIFVIAKYHLTDELFLLIKSDLKYALQMAIPLKEVYRFNDFFLITERGIDELNLVMEDINEEHREIINRIEETNIRCEETGKIVHLF